MPLTENEEALFAVANERITQGRLPRNVAALFWAEAGTGATCSLCDQTIQHGQVEYEFTGDRGVMIHFHMPCHAIWQLVADERISGS